MSMTSKRFAQCAMCKHLKALQCKGSRENNLKTNLGFCTNQVCPDPNCFQERILRATFQGGNFEQDYKRGGAMTTTLQAVDNIVHVQHCSIARD